MTAEREFGWIDVAIGQRLRTVRQARGLSQSALGMMIGVSLQQVQKYEKGANRIYASTLLRIAHHLNAPIDLFFEQASAALDSTQEPTDAGSPEKDDIRKILEQFGQLPGPNLRDAVIKLAKLLSEAGIDPKGL